MNIKHTTLHQRALGIALAMATLASVLFIPDVGAERRRPNIVYLILDEWAYYEWSAMGHPILDTPHFDRLAAEGMRFTQMLAGASVCAPTRSVLMTGLHLGHTPVRGNGGAEPLPEGEFTIARMLKEAGYATGGFGKWGVGAAGTTGVPEKQGFDVFFGYYDQRHAHTYYPAYLLRNSERVPLPGNFDDYHEGETFAQDLIHAEAMAFIRTHGTEGSPFFAYLPYTPPHGQWMMPRDAPEWIKYRGMEWDAEGQRSDEDPRMYAAMVEMMDRQLGEIRALLTELGVSENTLIFLSGDNGGANYFPTGGKYPDGFFGGNRDPKTGLRFRGGKGNYYEGGLRVPFVAHWQGHIPSGTVTDHLGYFPDLMPTIAEITGTHARPDTDGVSFAPTLFGEARVGRPQEQHEILIWSHAARQGNWKLVRARANQPWELYDLATDPGETNDVSAAHPQLFQSLIEKVAANTTPPRAGAFLDPEKGYVPPKRPRRRP